MIGMIYLISLRLRLLFAAHAILLNRLMLLLVLLSVNCHNFFEILYRGRLAIMRTLPLALKVFRGESFRVGHAQELLSVVLWLRICLLFFKTTSGPLLVSTLLGSWKHKVFVHAWFAELLLDLCLENIQFVFHIPIDVGEALFRRVIIGMLALLICKHWNHIFIKLLNLSGRIFTIIDPGRTFGAHLSNSRIIL